jgi:hypothetical protein
MKVWTFVKRNGNTTDFGPYATQNEAKSAFQRRYGYWPVDAIYSTNYEVTI